MHVRVCASTLSAHASTCLYTCFCRVYICVHVWERTQAAMGVLVFANPHRSNMKDLFSPFLFATSTEEVVLKIDEIEADLTLYSTLLQTTENLLHTYDIASLPHIDHFLERAAQFQAEPDAHCNAPGLYEALSSAGEDLSESEVQAAEMTGTQSLTRTTNATITPTDIPGHTYMHAEHAPHRLLFPDRSQRSPLPYGASSRSSGLDPVESDVHVWIHQPTNGSALLPSELIPMHLELHVPSDLLLGAEYELHYLVDGQLVKALAITRLLQEGLTVAAVSQLARSRVVAASSHWQLRTGRGFQDYTTRHLEDVLSFSKSGSHEIRCVLFNQTSMAAVAEDFVHVSTIWTDKISSDGGLKEGQPSTSSMERLVTGNQMLRARLAKQNSDRWRQDRPRGHAKARRALSLFSRDLLAHQAQKDRQLVADLIQNESNLEDQERDLRVIFVTPGHEMIARDFEDLPFGTTWLTADQQIHANIVPFHVFDQEYKNLSYNNVTPVLQDAFYAPVFKWKADVMFGPRISMNTWNQDPDTCFRAAVFEDPLGWPPFTYETKDGDNTRTCVPTLPLELGHLLALATYDVVIALLPLELSEANLEAIKDSQFGDQPSAFHLDLWEHAKSALDKQARFWLPTFSYVTVKRHYDLIQPILKTHGFCHASAKNCGLTKPFAYVSTAAQ